MALQFSSDETELDEGDPNTNFATATSAIVTKGGKLGIRQRVIFHGFDLSSLAGETVATAKLVIPDVTSPAGSALNSGKLSRVLQVMGDGISVVTWDSYTSANAWDAAGCSSDGIDYTSQDEVTFFLPDSPGALEIPGVEAMANVALADDMILRLRLTGDESGNDGFRFSTTNHGTPANWPYLEITLVASGGQPAGVRQIGIPFFGQRIGRAF